MEITAGGILPAEGMIKTIITAGVRVSCDDRGTATQEDLQQTGVMV